MQDKNTTESTYMQLFQPILDKKFNSDINCKVLKILPAGTNSQPIEEIL